MTPPMATDAEHPAIECGVLPTGFWPPSGPISPCYTSVPTFQMGIFYSVFSIASCSLALDFRRVHCQR